MTTDRVTKPTVQLDRSLEALSDETLDRVAGGLNPQPLPPGELRLDPPPLPASIYAMRWA